jgi:hypothetical protein
LRRATAASAGRCRTGVARASRIRLPTCELPCRPPPQTWAGLSGLYEGTRGIGASHAGCTYLQPQRAAATLGRQVHRALARRPMSPPFLLGGGSAMMCWPVCI